MTLPSEERGIDMRKRVKGCLTVLCLASLMLSGCSGQRERVSEIKETESSSMAMAEDSVAGRDGALQSTEKGQTPEDEQNIEDAVRTAGKAETGGVRAEDDYYNYVNQKHLS